jgi:hypothetical protein
VASTDAGGGRELGERHPLYLAVHDDGRRSRLTVLLRPLLALPHLGWAGLWTLAALLAAAAQWWVVVATGHPAGLLHTFLARYGRYSTRVQAYLFLIADPYPRFPRRARTYPVDLVVDPPARQSRWKTILRPVLALPPLVFAAVLTYVLRLLALVAWFVAILLARVPAGMRDLAAYCLRYQEQTSGYLLLLTDRYPSIAAERPREQPAASLS